MVDFLKGNAGRLGILKLKVYEPGFHVFMSEDDLVFRLCYYWTKERVYYVQMSIKVKNTYNCAG